MNNPLHPNGNTAIDSWLAHESLIVYDMALKFHLAAMTLLPMRGHTNLRDQLERASLSVVLNIAEGAGRSSIADATRSRLIRRQSYSDEAAAAFAPPLATATSAGRSTRSPMV